MNRNQDLGWTKEKLKRKTDNKGSRNGMLQATH